MEVFCLYLSVQALTTRRLAKVAFSQPEHLPKATYSQPEQLERATSSQLWQLAREVSHLLKLAITASQLIQLAREASQLEQLLCGSLMMLMGLYLPPQHQMWGKIQKNIFNRWIIENLDLYLYTYVYISSRYIIQNLSSFHSLFQGSIVLPSNENIKNLFNIRIHERGKFYGTLCTWTGE